MKNNSKQSSDTGHEAAWERTLHSLSGRDNYFVLETNLISDQEKYHYLFLDSVEEVAVAAPEEIDAAFARIESGVNDGLYAAGFFSYELGYCLEDNLFEPPEKHFLPLLHVGLYKTAYVFDAAAGAWVGDAPDLRDGDAPEFSLSEPVFSETWPAYHEKIKEIKHRIELGDTYQINYTLRLHFLMQGDPLGLYLNLRDRQKVAYSGLWRHGELSVITLSPELFFRIGQGGRIEVRPMKGTVRRGDDPQEDARHVEFLHNDIKNRAENVMIVDLLRNDLGRVSRSGSVNVPRLFDVEPYETLFQMTSTVQSELEPGADLRRIFTSLFPSGSVTGAPKISSMKIIRELESTPRGIYTGAVGFIAPRRVAAVFNVAIRTVAARGPHAEMGLGGGIVYDSDPESEWREALLKGDFLLGALEDAAPRDFSLIETLLWAPQQGYYLAQLHLERLMFSADHFGFHYDINEVARRLSEFAQTLAENDVPQRVRMLMDMNGRLTFTNFDIDADFSLVEPLSTFSERTVFSGSPFLRHKTTVRGFYNAEHERAVNGGYVDVIFLNERGEVTEGTITNVMVRLGDTVYTPPLHCGLLDGVFRRHLLETKQVKERVLYPEDVTGAAAVYLCNSVRGLFKVNFRVPSFLHGSQAIKSGSCGGH